MHDRAGLGTRESQPYAGPDNERYAGLMLPVKPGPESPAAAWPPRAGVRAGIPRPAGHQALSPGGSSPWPAVHNRAGTFRDSGRLPNARRTLALGCG